MQVKIYDVDNDISLREFLESKGITYKKGIGFYQLSSKKKETISNIKMVVVRRKSDGVLITGEGVRSVLGLPDDTVSFSIKNEDVDDFDIFVQSTSPQRKLFGGNKMLCVVEDGGTPVIDINEVKETPKDTNVPKVVPKAKDGISAVEVLITFDTTGSMYPCLTQVRRNVRQMIKDLFNAVPGIRIAVMAHGDYGDKYVTKHVDLSVDAEELCKFVETVESTYGADWEECYELVLRKAHTEISWSSVANKAIMMIGDAIPHAPNSSRNAPKINWRTEAAAIANKGINFYSIQALGNRSAGDSFWKPLAVETNGVHLNLDQFSHTKDYIMAICFHSHSNEQLQNFRDQVKSEGRMNRSLHNMFNALLKQSGDFAGEESTLDPVPPSRFQVLDVGDSKVSIKQFAQDNGLTFKTGKGFYEFTKSEVISEKKEVVLMDKNSGDMFTGQEAIDMIGAGGRTKIRPTSFDKWRVFVQSTSANRVLVPNTGFLYEVDTDC